MAFSLPQEYPKKTGTAIINEQLSMRNEELTMSNEDKDWGLMTRTPAEPYSHNTL
jgi:hypothetical protein